MIYNKLKLRKNEKGITLLALIVTLIVLLILAGVSIAVLVGENGIIDNAVKAKKATDAASAKERVDLAIMAAKIESKKNNINLTTVKSELVKNGLTIVGDGDTFPLTVTDDTNIFKISENGTVTKILKLTATDIAANKEKYYGQEVKNYTAGGRTYRIFYVDEEGYFGERNTIYLKADSSSAEKIELLSKCEYIPTTTLVLENMNKLWANNRIEQSNDWNRGEHSASYLCDPTTEDSNSNQAWADYFDSTIANYAIGSPSLEMYVKSYNQVSHIEGNYELETVYNQQRPTGYMFKATSNIPPQPGEFPIFTIRDDENYATEENVLDSVGYNGMYCGEEQFWLSSSHNYVNGVCVVRSTTKKLEGLSLGNIQAQATMAAMCPLVSVKTGLIIEVEE